MPIKMYAIFARETLREMKFEGKLAAQAGHAYLHAWWDAESRFYYDGPDSKYARVMDEYRDGNDARKIALVVDTVADLEHIYELYRPHMGATIVDDCGYTVFDCTTTTAVGLGPIDDDWFEEGALLKSLKSLKKEIK